MKVLLLLGLERVSEGTKENAPKRRTPSGKKVSSGWKCERISPAESIILELGFEIVECAYCLF